MKHDVSQVLLKIYYPSLHNKIIFALKTAAASKIMMLIRTFPALS